MIKVTPTGSIPRQVSQDHQAHRSLGGRPVFSGKRYKDERQRRIRIFVAQQPPTVRPKISVRGRQFFGLPGPLSREPSRLGAEWTFGNRLRDLDLLRPIFVYNHLFKNGLLPRAGFQRKDSGRSCSTTAEPRRQLHALRLDLNEARKSAGPDGGPFQIRTIDPAPQTLSSSRSRRHRLTRVKKTRSRTTSRQKGKAAGRPPGCDDHTRPIKRVSMCTTSYRQSSTSVATGRRCATMACRNSGE